MSPVTAPVAPITPEQFLELPDRDRYELVGGELRPFPQRTPLSLAITNAIYDQFWRQMNAAYSGCWTGDETVAFQCFPDEPCQIRRMHVNFTKTDNEELRTGLQNGLCHFVKPPVFAVRIASREELASDIYCALDDFLDAGTQLVWIVTTDPDRVKCVQADGKMVIVRKGGTLSADYVFPGVAFSIDEVFDNARKTVLAQ